MSLVWWPSKTWRIGNRNCLTTHGSHSCNLLRHFNGEHTGFECLSDFSQLSRRIRKRRAAQRRAIRTQQKAWGTLLTRLRPVSYCGLWRLVKLSFVRHDTSWKLVSYLNHLIDSTVHVFKGNIHVWRLSCETKTNSPPRFSSLGPSVLPRYWEQIEFPIG